MHTVCIIIAQKEGIVPNIWVISTIFQENSHVRNESSKKYWTNAKRCGIIASVLETERGLVK